MLKPIKVRPNVPGDQDRYERDMKDFTENPGNWGYVGPRAQLVPVPIGGEAPATLPPAPLQSGEGGGATSAELDDDEREELARLRAEKAAREARNLTPGASSPDPLSSTAGEGEAEEKPVASASRKSRRKRPAGKTKAGPE